MNTFDFVPGMLAQAVSDGIFPSATVSIGVKGENLYTGAAGAADVETRFDLASMSKVVGTTMVALKALEEGRIALYDTLGLFLADVPEEKAGLTILHLMTHTGGFMPSFRLDKLLQSPDDALRCILETPLPAPVDGTPRYSCMGYILLGKVLEAVYGKPLDVLANEMVFTPLGMAHTSYNPTGGNIAPTEIDPETGKAIVGIVHDENARFLRGISGNAGVFSNIGDCTRFASMLAKGGDGFLSPATMACATHNYTPGHDEYRGLGFNLAGSPFHFMGDLFPASAYGHTGFTGTSFAVDPSTGFYVVLLTNRVHPTRENAKLIRFRRLFHNKLYAAFSRA